MKIKVQNKRRKSQKKNKQKKNNYLTKPSQTKTKT